MSINHPFKLEDEDKITLPQVHPFALYGAWRAQVVMGTEPGNKHTITRAVRQLYEEYGRRPPWMVWCAGPFQIAAFATILPRVLCSAEWRMISAWYRDNVYPNEDWNDAWAGLFSEYIEPLVVDVARGIPSEYFSNALIQNLNRRLRSELNRRIRSEARAGSGLPELPKDYFVYSQSLSTNLARTIAARLSQQMAWRLGGREIGILSDDAQISNELTRQQCAALETVARRAMLEFSDVTAADSQQFTIRPAWFLPWLELFVINKTRLPERSDVDAELAAWAQLAAHTSALFCTDEFCFVAEKPEEIHIDDRRRPHSENGPCVRFRDGFEIYAFQGVGLNRHVITNPEEITPESIAAERNIEARRVLTQLYGIERFLMEGNATCIHQDECGELFMQTTEPGRIRWATEPIMWLRVKNSTPEPDGTYRYYVLRVPPHMATARQAVAWTFGMLENEYKPKKQT